MYNTFTGVDGYKIWESNSYDYGYPSRRPRQSNKKPKHKYQVNDKVLDVVEGEVGYIRELLSWPDYLVGTSSESWVCSESHIEPLVNDNADEVSPTMNHSDYWEEEQEPSLSIKYNPLSTGISDVTVTDTGDIMISRNKPDLANDGGICVTDTVNKHDNDIEDLRHVSDINMQRVTNIECRHNDIEQKVEDLEKKQRRISKLSKLALLSKFL
jgi:hypothetical protein